MERRKRPGTFGGIDKAVRAGARFTGGRWDWKRQRGKVVGGTLESAARVVVAEMSLGSGGQDRAAHVSDARAAWFYACHFQVMKDRRCIFPAYRFGDFFGRQALPVKAYNKRCLFSPVGSLPLNPSIRVRSKSADLLFSAKSNFKFCLVAFSNAYSTNWTRSFPLLVMPFRAKQAPNPNSADVDGNRIHLTLGVFGQRDGLQMVWIDTSTITAKVVYAKAVRNFPVDATVSSPVDKIAFAVFCMYAISVRTDMPVPNVAWGAIAAIFGANPTTKRLPLAVQTTGGRH